MENKKQGIWGRVGAWLMASSDVEQRSTNNSVMSSDTAGLARLFGLDSTGGVVRVNDDTALSLAAYINCIIILSEDVSTLPCNVYKRNNTGGRTVDGDHPIHSLLHNKPNPLMTASQWQKLQMWKINHKGNSINLIERDPVTFRPRALWPLPSDEVIDVELKSDGSLVYVTKTHGKVDSMDILHYKRISENGFFGQSLLAYQKELLSMGLNSQRYGKEFYENGATADVVLSHPSRVSDTAIANIKKQYDDTRQDKRTGDVSRTLVLQEGMTLEKISFSPSDAAFVETQGWTAKSVAGLFRVPLEFLGYTENSNNSIAENAVDSYVKFGLAPYLTMMEQENNDKLFREKEKNKYFTKYNLNALLRGDIATRFESYAKMLDRGVYSINDVLDWEDLPRVDNGEMRFVQINNVLPLESVTDYTQTLIKKQLTDGKGDKSK